MIHNMTQKTRLNYWIAMLLNQLQLFELHSVIRIRFLPDKRRGGFGWLLSLFASSKTPKRPINFAVRTRSIIEFPRKINFPRSHASITNIFEDERKTKTQMYQIVCKDIPEELIFSIVYKIGAIRMETLS